jgi:hypothetical protein
MALCAMPFLVAACSGDTGPGEPGRKAPVGGSSTGGARNAVCSTGTSGGEVEAPVFWKNLRGETSWFASPVVIDLDGDGKNELVAAYYSIFVFGSDGEELARIPASETGNSRVYAPHVVADLEGDGIVEIIFGNGGSVYAFEWVNGAPRAKQGWPASADNTDNGKSPEVRGMAAADLDGDGSIEIVVTTTETASTESGGAQVFVYNADGSLYQPAGISWNAWPRYNAATGPGNDADRNGYGHHGYGCYGLNVGIGNIDDDPELEILATYDNHHIQAFDHDGVALDASSWFTNRASAHAGERLTWGQFIRWADPAVEEAHYHLHEGDWPDINQTEWLQFTQSPPSVADLDLDGKAEVIGVPNIEMKEPYVTQAWAVMVLEGAHGDGSRSAMRKAGWEVLPRGDGVLNIDGWYPPSGVPAPVIVNLQGDARPEIVVSLNDYFIHAFNADGSELWRYNMSHDRPILFASEPTVADLNQDGSPEILFTTFGDPDVLDSGYLVILGADGSLLHDVPLPNPGRNGNGNGAPAAPAVGDLDGDGTLEVFVQTFEHGLDVFTIPGSATNCVLWSTARGGPLRTGQP